MTESLGKSEKIKKNTSVPEELWQETTTPLTHEMIYGAVVEKYPDLFVGHELVKFEGGTLPSVKTKRLVTS